MPLFRYIFLGLIVILLATTTFAQGPGGNSPVQSPVEFIEEDAAANVTVDEDAPEDPDKKADTVEFITEEFWYKNNWMKGLVSIATESRKEARKISGILQRQVVEFLSVMLVIWILFQIGKLVLAFGPDGGGAKVMNGVFIRIFLAMIIVLLVRSPNIVWGIHEAVSTAGASSAQLVLMAATDGLEDAELDDISCGEQFLTVTGELDEAEYGTESQAAAQLECTVTMAAKTLGVGLTVGLELFGGKNLGGMGPSSAGFYDQFTQAATNVAQRPIMLIAAMILVYFYGSMMIAIPFRIIDVIFKWTIITILAPVLLVSFLFPISRNIAMSGLKVLFHSAMALLILSVVVAIIFSLMIFVISQDDYGSVAAIYESDEIIEDALGSKLLIYLMTIGLFGKAMIDKVPELTSRALSIPNTLKIPELGQKMFGAASTAVMAATGGAATNAINKNWQKRQAYNNRMKGALKRAKA